MKINFIPALIAIAIAALIAYGMYSLSDSENKNLLGCGSFILAAGTLLTAFGLSFEKARTGANVRTLAVLFFTITLGSNVAFSFVEFTPPVYVITSGILFLLFILVSYFIVKVNH